MSEARAILSQVVPEAEITSALVEAATRALANFDKYDWSKDGKLSYDEFKKIPETASEAEVRFSFLSLTHYLDLY